MAYEAQYSRICGSESSASGSNGLDATMDGDGTEVINIVVNPDQDKVDSTQYIRSNQRDFNHSLLENDLRTTSRDNCTSSQSPSYQVDNPSGRPSPVGRREDRRTRQMASYLSPPSQIGGVKSETADDELYPSSKRMYSSNNRMPLNSAASGHARDPSPPPPPNPPSQQWRRPFGQQLPVTPSQHYSSRSSSGFSDYRAPGQDTSSAASTPSSIRPALTQQAPPLMTGEAVQSQALMLAVGNEVSDNGEVTCIFCNKADGTVICLGSACCSFLNGKLPVLCDDCSHMLHMHHPNHRLFRCHYSGFGGKASDEGADSPSDDVHDYSTSTGSPKSMKLAKLAGRGKGKMCKLELLETIHQRYMVILMYVIDNPNTSMTDAYRGTGISRTTLQDNRWITELKLVDEDRYDQLMEELLKDEHLPRLPMISLACQGILAEEPLASRVSIMRATKRLLPFTSMREPSTKVGPGSDNLKIGKSS